MSLSETTIPPAERRSALTRWLDRLSGFDFFISYAHADAPDYVEQLAAGLRDKGFKAFLDKQVYVAGDELNSATRRRIEASSKLVVVVGPQARRSHWVLQELEIAIRLNRPVIAIDLTGDLAAQETTGRLDELLKDRIHIREQHGLGSKEPTAATMEALARSFQATRRESRQRRIAVAVALFFALLAVFAFWQKNLADERYLAHKKLCDDVVARVAEGRAKIEGLRIGRFGELIADVTKTLANLPDPKTDLKCEPDAS